MLLNSNFRYVSLLSSVISASSTTYVSGELSESCSNFDMLLITIIPLSGSQRNSFIIPSLFFDNSEFYENIIESSSVYSYGAFKVSGKTIQVACKLKAGWTGMRISAVHGIKIHI